MGQREGFGSGFIAGSIVGGIVGGAVGAWLSARSRSPAVSSQEELFPSPDADSPPSETPESLEGTRRHLEEKIAQLNLAIEEVRDRLGNVDEGTPLPSPSDRDAFRS